MKRMGGLRPLELGQSAAKSVRDDFIKPNAKVVATQITGKSFGSPMSQPKAPDAGDFGKVLEQNQSQQNSSANTIQNPLPQENLDEKFANQQKVDQEKLSTARNALQELEQKMEKVKEEREKNWEQMNQKEEEEKKIEELQIKEQQKQQPISAGQRSGEIKGNKG